MPRLFISHSSKDCIQALAIQRWLELKGWSKDDVFIDLHDMKAGERWRDTLVKANVACEALLYLASPEALASDECRREVRRADDDRKDVIVAILRDLTLDDQRLHDYKDRQIMDLSIDPREERVEVEHEGRKHLVDFNRAALNAIHATLIELGIAPDSFAWPPKDNPKAAPYPDLDAFDEKSTGIKAARKALGHGGGGARLGMAATAILLIGTAPAFGIDYFYMEQQRATVEATKIAAHQKTEEKRKAEEKRRTEAARKAEEEAARKRTEYLRTGRTFRDCPNCPEMVVVPSGSFMMGSPKNEKGRYEDEGTSSGKGGSQVNVTIPRPFAMGKYEVTFDDWDACVAGRGCSHKPKDEGWGRGNRPVINVSWKDAKTYVTWLNAKVVGKPYRLPTEAEWEYVARAKSTTSFWWGDKASHKYANYGKDQCCGGLAKGKDKSKYTAPVGSFSPNAFGLHDMHGNVYEWVEDCYHGSYNEAPTDGSANTAGNCTIRVLRGGSWVSGPEGLRSAFRVRDQQGNRDNLVGFRIARTLTP